MYTLSIHYRGQTNLEFGWPSRPIANSSILVMLSGGISMAERHLILDELVARGFVTPDDAFAIIQRATATRQPILRLLREENLIKEIDAYKVAADLTRSEFVDLAEMADIDHRATGKFTAEDAKRFRAIPYGYRGKSLLFAVEDPSNPNLKDELRRFVGVEPILVLTTPALLDYQMNETYRADLELEGIGKELESSAGANEVNALDILNNNNNDDEVPVVKWVNLTITQAISDRASDIHIEPGEVNFTVRYRIDGVLHPVFTASMNTLPALVARIKIMSNMDTAEKRNPQDGRAVHTLSPTRKVDLRTTTVPTIYGEKIVIRILDNSGIEKTVENIGFSDYHQQIYARYYDRSHGMILVTGPTGSGKSTTLYATLNTIKNPSINIMTIEDPVETRMKGVNQININKAAGLTFDKILRSLLRADPDVMLVGEIRDIETASLAVEAAQTGHLVLSTLHTNDAASAVTRLIEMEVEPFLVGSALTLVVAQRLLRRLCSKCSVYYEPEDSTLISVGFPWTPGEPKPRIKKAVGVGCRVCSKTGYMGRLGIHEMLEIDSNIERLINKRASTDEIRSFAVNENKMKLMREDGWEKVLNCETTIEEVLRATR